MEGFAAGANTSTNKRLGTCGLLALKSRLADDLSVMAHLHDLGSRLIATSRLQPLLQEALDTSIRLVGADFGNIQLYSQQTGALEIVAQHGFDQASLHYFSRVDAGHAACGRAVQYGARVVIEDVEADADFAPHRAIAAASGFRAVQSAPLRNRAGELLGLFSTHFRQPHQFTEHELWLTDLYAGQAAEMIGFNRGQEQFRQAHDELAARVTERTQQLADANAALVLEKNERRRAEQAQRRLLQQLVSTEEEERRRISRELHDSLGQHLTALHFGLKSALAHDNVPPAVAGILQQLRELAWRIDEELDRLSFELRPPGLDDLGLAAALRLLIEEWSATSGISADLHTGGLGHRRLPATIETTVYRVVQEALTNVHKHARGTSVSLIVERRDGEVLVIIEDNGRGFNAEAVANLPGGGRKLGLRGMEERATLAGGRLDIETAPDAGTTIYLHIPLSEAQA